MLANQILEVTNEVPKVILSDALVQSSGVYHAFGGAGSCRSSHRHQSGERVPRVAGLVRATLVVHHGAATWVGHSGCLTLLEPRATGLHAKADFEPRPDELALGGPVRRDVAAGGGGHLMVVLVTASSHQIALVSMWIRATHHCEEIDLERLWRY